MLRLRPYKAGDAQEITRWIRNERELRMWGVDRYKSYPITAEDMNEYYDKDRESPNVWGMTAFDEAGIVGHFTMRFLDEKREEVRFGFVIVKPEGRGKGYGKEMLSLGIRYAFDFLKVAKISLAVFENNVDAIRCYEACGFQKIEGEKEEAFPCLGEYWDSFHMELVGERTKLIPWEERDSKLIEGLLELWEASVKATHLFLGDQERLEIKKVIPKALKEIPILIVEEDENRIPIAFMGINQEKLEMLFISPRSRGKGYGRKLMSDAINQYKVKTLGVNEQNPQAIGFYEHLGFRVYERKEKDELGNAYPILYMEWKGTGVR